MESSQKASLTSKYNSLRCPVAVDANSLENGHEVLAITAVAWRFSPNSQPAATVSSHRLLPTLATGAPTFGPKPTYAARSNFITQFRFNYFLARTRFDSARLHFRNYLWGFPIDVKFGILPNIYVTNAVARADFCIRVLKSSKNPLIIINCKKL